MIWFKALAILFCSAVLSLHAKAEGLSNIDPSSATKDSLKVEQKLKFNPLMLFSLPKAVDPIEQKESAEKKKEEELGAI